MAQSTSENTINWQAVGEETIARVRDLLRLDTRNPPGNEIRAAEYLHNLFEAEGIPGEIVGPSGDRGTFIARLKGDGAAPPLLLMSHTDVVAVEPEKWTHDPFSGDIAGGFMYGRGALDMKQMVTMEAMTMLLLKRNNVPRDRDVVFLAESGEEADPTGVGIVFMVREHYDEIDAEYSLTEGGGATLTNGKVTTVNVGTAEKLPARSSSEPAAGNR